MSYESNNLEGISFVSGKQLKHFLSTKLSFLKIFIIIKYLFSPYTEPIQREPKINMKKILTRVHFSEQVHIMT